MQNEGWGHVTSNNAYKTKRVIGQKQQTNLPTQQNTVLLNSYFHGEIGARCHCSLNLSTVSSLSLMHRLLLALYVDVSVSSLQMNGGET